jgi:HTH-type transcriptional regulator/antitoxin HigA
MPVLLYTVIKTRSKYNKYCDELEKLLDKRSKSKFVNDEIDLLTLLIEDWDNRHNSFEEIDPVELLKSLMEDHQLKAKDLSDLLQVSKGYVSDILHYKKAFSKEITRKLADHFKLRQEAFNRPYLLKELKKVSSSKKKQVKASV